MSRPLAISCDSIDCRALLSDWNWLVPPDHSPLLIGAFGDWIMGAPDGSLWSLSLLDGSYEQVAPDSASFNAAKNEPEKLDAWFNASWVAIAADHGLVPAEDECLGWKLHPKLGGAFAAPNIGIFTLRVYQSLMGQLHRQLR
jgi:hypothetical protein